VIAAGFFLPGIRGGNKGGHGNRARNGFQNLYG
jgi:hypothetical protein